MKVPGRLKLRAVAAAIAALCASAEFPEAHASGVNASIAHSATLLGANLLSAVIRNVNSCADDLTTGTLREVVALAGDGDTIDLHTNLPLACSTITLAHGEIKTPPAADHIYLEGPSDRQLTITLVQPAGGPYSRILNHPTSGTMGIKNLTLTNGKYKSTTGNALGGCIYSAGGLTINSSTLSGCFATAAKPAGGSVAQGGAAMALGVVTLIDSQLTGNFVTATGSNEARGGAVFSYLDFDSYYSTVSGNTAVGGSHAIGGGITANRGVKLVNSTIDSNSAVTGGGIYQIGPVGGPVDIINSTISGNRASGSEGALYALSNVAVHNSTVAFNSSGNSAAIVVHGNVYARSSIFADNTAVSSAFSDVYVAGIGNGLGGANCVITSSNLGGVANTITLDPQLTPLAYHGGVTRTHALLATSPAIDQGLDRVSTNGLDQRGVGYDRLVGGAADIGAYERQVADDEIFYDGFR